MGAERRIVRHMALTAPKRAAVRRVLPEIADAFRTATLPGAGQGGVLLVRRLDLGTIAPGTTRQALSRRIGEAARQAGAVSARADAPVDADAPALLWADRVELLAAAMLAMERPGPAPWWVTRALGLRHGPVTPGAAAAAVQRLADRAGPEALGALVLRMMALDAPPAAFAPLSPALERAAAALGVPAASAPVPARDGVAAAPPSGAVAPDSLPKAPTSPLAAALALWQALPVLTRRMGAPLRDAGALPDTACAALAVLVAARLHGRGAVPALLAEALRADRRAGADTNPLRAAPSAGALPVPVDAPPPPRLAGAGAVRAVPDAPGGAAEPAGVPPVGPGPFAALLPEAVTRLGGLPLLVMLVRLGGLEPLDAELGTDLCMAVLRRLIGAAAPDDPIRAALPEPAALPPDIAQAPPFVPDAAMLAAAGLRFALAPVSGRPGLRLLREARTGLPLGLLDRTALAALARAAGRARLRRACGGPVRGDLAAGLALALRRALRQATGRPWRAALLRSGYMALTATHLDVTLDLDDVRLPERRAGLDLSPGWVPWIGLVVTLHFERFVKGGTGLSP